MKKHLSGRFALLRGICLFGAILLFSLAAVSCEYFAKPSFGGILGDSDSRPSASTQAEGSYIIIFDPRSRESVIYRNGKPVGDPLHYVGISGAIETSIQSAANGRSSLIITNQRRLAVATKKELLDVWNNISNVRISLNGNSVGIAGQDGRLFLYDVTKDKLHEITDNYTGSGFCLSPNGKTMAYMDGNNVTYIRTEKELEQTDTDIPLAISDDAELFYFYDFGKEAYILRTEKEDIRLGEGRPEDFRFIFNNDHTEVLVSGPDGVRLFADGEEKDSIIGSPEMYFAKSLRAYEESQLVSSLPIRTFEGFYFLTGDHELRQITRGRSYWIADGVVQFDCPTASGACYYTATDDPAYLYSENAGSQAASLESNPPALYRLSDPNKSPVLIAEAVTKFVVTGNGEACYFITPDQALQYAHKADKPIHVANSAVKLYITPDDRALYTVGTGRLYRAYKGKDATLIEENASDIVVDGNATYYTVLNDPYHSTYDVYYAEEKAQFTRIAEDVSVGFGAN